MRPCSGGWPTGSTTSTTPTRCELETLELRTKEAIAPAPERAGISTAPDPEMLGLAEALASGSAAKAREEVMSSLVSVTGQFIPLYGRIGQLDPSESQAADLLVAHEEALPHMG